VIAAPLGVQAPAEAVFRFEQQDVAVAKPPRGR
jgi:hypothetical protein